VTDKELRGLVRKETQTSPGTIVPNGSEALFDETLLCSVSGVFSAIIFYM